MYGIVSLLSAQNLFFYWGQPVKSYVIISTLMSVILYAIARLIKEKKHCTELELHLNIVENAVEEFRNIRHQYNNMFQSTIFYIENGQVDSDKNFVDEIMKKTSELNNNNTLQLIKIKNRQIRSSIFQMAKICEDNGIDINIVVYGEVNHINMHESALGNALVTIFNNIYEEVLRLDKKEINIEIISESQGISIIFDSYSKNDSKLNKHQHTGLTGNSKTRKDGPGAIKRIMAQNKNIIYNSYIDNDYHRREIMIMS